MSTNNSITYRQVGDYMIPNLTLPPEEANIKLGKWGMLHKDYLKNHKSVIFSTLLTQGKLYQHCADIEIQAQQMFDALFEQMKQKENVTEQLKEKNQVEWICCMQNIKARIVEIITKELIYA